MLDFIIDWLNINVNTGQTGYNTYYQYVVMACLVLCIIFSTEILFYLRLAITSLLGKFGRK